jgi:ABC-type lipoprotein export system ATPase subunit
MAKKFNKGSLWRVWDLQVQTILDDGYISLSNYYEQLKNDQPITWQIYIDKVGSEANALQFDSREYFADGSIPESERCLNYARNLFSFIEAFKPNLGLIGFTDHNYSHPTLLDSLFHYGQKASCKCLCGVEINASGVHILAYFEKPPFSKDTFSEGIKTFLDSINVNQPKKKGVLTVSDESVMRVVDAIRSQSGLYIFPHCNSNNGLFQERGRTDRTHLADIFNYQEVILLQAGSHESSKKTSDYIKSKEDQLRSKHIFTISSDSRCLIDIGKPDVKDCYTWVKADPTFQGLRQILIENDRVEISDEPELIKRVSANKTKFIRSVAVKKTNEALINDIWFEDFNLELNSGLIAIIGNKGSGKSAVADIIGLCGNTHQDPSNYSFLTHTKFRKPKPVNLAERFEATLTWEDDSQITKRLSHNPDKNLAERVKYIPQNFLETVCANVESDDFEKELKQIIYDHTPTEQRFNKGSLDELIEYKSNLITNEILKLKANLSELNHKIVFLEGKSRQDFRTSIENQIELKRNELTAHDTIKPIQPKALEDSSNTEEVNHINDLRKQLETKEEEIKAEKSSRSVLLLDSEELKQASQYFENRRIDLIKEVSDENPHIKVLIKNEIPIEDVFSFKVNTAPILEKTTQKTNSITVINEDVDDNREGSKAFDIKLLAQQIKERQDLLDKPAKEQQKYLSDLKTWTFKKNQIEGDKDTEGSLNYFLGQLEYLQNDLPGELSSKYQERNNVVAELFSKKQELTRIRKDLFEPVSKFIDDYKELKDRYDVKFDVALELRNFFDNFFAFVNQGRVGTFSGKEDGYKRLSELAEKANFEDVESFKGFADTLIFALKHDLRSDENAEVDISTQLKSGRELHELYDFIYGYDYLQPMYNLKLGNKTLQELSPGERGALLLIFYLILDNNDIPLIIDQPEENLDNESVYHILVHFIKKVKERRQIVIVTHNPNLAIVCDADQIIHMKIDKKNRNKVEYVSGAIEDFDINKSAVDILEGTLPAFRNRDSKYIKEA